MCERELETEQNCNTIKTSGHSSLEKYTSHFIESVVCERELETEQNCNILTPTLLAIIAFLSFFHSGLLNRAPGGRASLGVSFLYSILAPTRPSLQLTDFLSSPGLYNNLTSSLLPARVTISHSFNPSMVKVIISWYSSTECTCYLHMCISYFDSLAGSEVNIQ